MELRAHREFWQKIEDEQRDIAVTAAPGMGLSYILDSLRMAKNISVAWVKVDELRRLWDIEYKDRRSNRRFVIHAATISAIIQSGYVKADVSEQQLFKTNLPAFLKEHTINSTVPIIIAIEEFETLPIDLALLILKELKSLDDSRSQPQYNCLRTIRFVISGAFSFANIFAGQIPTGVSPATNFHKIRSPQFLLSETESKILLDETFPEIHKLPPSITQIIVDWAGGYLHYLVEFAKWILIDYQQQERLTEHAIITRLKDVVQDLERIPLFQYCYLAWNHIRDNVNFVELSAAAISTGQVHDSSGKANELACLGLLIKDRTQSNVFFPSNRLVELFLRQRLAELDKVNCIQESVVWIIPTLNAHAYKLLLEIENQLRNFIGDRLCSKYGNLWYDQCLSAIKAEDGSFLLDKIKSRKESEQQNIYATDTMIDPILAYLDFPDLGSIVTAEKDRFPERFSTNFPHFLAELNFYRRRIAHNRLITMSHIQALESRWRIIQKAMSYRV